ncbi:MAG: TetR/AcrR family transcriptional regulator [Pseudolysinimonas sp.]
MIDAAVMSTRSDSQAPIRNEPVQARSTARLAALLDAAAHVIDEIGYERLTTAMVADRAGASIGTVYRYFPDRIAVLQSLAARNAERVGEQALAELKNPRHDSWTAALEAGYEVFRAAFRSEPGFAALRFGDVLDLRPLVGVPALRQFSDRAAAVMVDRFGMSDSAEAKLTLQSVLMIADSIAADAFQRDPHGDAAILRHAILAAHALLKEYFPASAR